MGKSDLFKGIFTRNSFNVELSRKVNQNFQEEIVVEVTKNGSGVAHLKLAKLIFLNGKEYPIGDLGHPHIVSKQQPVSFFFNMSYDYAKNNNLFSKDVSSVIVTEFDGSEHHFPKPWNIIDKFRFERKMKKLVSSSLKDDIPDYEFEIPMSDTYKEILFNIIQLAIRSETLTFWFEETGSNLVFSIRYKDDSRTVFENTFGNPLKYFHEMGLIKITENKAFLVTPKLFRWAAYQKKKPLLKWWERDGSKNSIAVIALVISIISAIASVISAIK